MHPCEGYLFLTCSGHALFLCLERLTHYYHSFFKLDCVSSLSRGFAIHLGCFHGIEAGLELLNLSSPPSGC